MAKGYTRPVAPGSTPVPVPAEILDAQQKLACKRKLTLIMRSKSVHDYPVSTGDIVQVFIKRQNEKRGSWSSPKPVLSFDHKSGSVVVPGRNGHKIKAALEDTRIAVVENELAMKVQEAIDDLQSSLDISIDDAIDSSDGEANLGPSQYTKEAFGNNDEPGNFDMEDSCGMVLPQVGDSIEVFWPIDDQYYPGTVASFNDATGKFAINYNDGEKENLRLQDETWRFSVDDTPIPGVIASNEIELTPGQDLKSVERQAVGEYFKCFGNKEFMLYQAQALPPFITQNAYDKEENAFLKTVRPVHVSEIPERANIITSHVLYKVKNCDDGTQIMKARIAPHGNKDCDKDGLKTDSTSCPPIGIRSLISIASIFKWFLVKIDFKSAFLQTGNAKRDVYVVPPRECSTRSSHYWLLLAATYGLVNANAKWQEHSDHFLSSIGYKQLSYIPQLFYITESSKLVSAAVKVVDDVLMAGNLDRLKQIVEKVKCSYELGTVVYGPGVFQFFGLTVIQSDDLTVQLHANDKINACEAFPIDRQRRKQVDAPLNKLENSSYRSLNSSLGWIGVAISPFCAHAASYLQQKGPTPTVGDLITQINMLRSLKKLGTTVTFNRPSMKGSYAISLVVFADASRKQDHGQLGMLSGLLFGELSEGSTVHVLSWSSRKSKRPVKSIASAETLAVGEAIDEGKLLRNAFERLLNIEIELVIILDSKDLFDTLSTCRNATDRSIRADVNVIRFEFETRAVSRMIWTTGATNLADPLTKHNSPLTQALELLLFDGSLPFSLSDSITRRSDQSTYESMILYAQVVLVRWYRTNAYSTSSPGFAPLQFFKLLQ